MNRLHRHVPLKSHLKSKRLFPATSKISKPLHDENTTTTTNNNNNDANIMYNLYNASTSKITNQVQMATADDIKQSIIDSQTIQQHWYNDYTLMQRSQVILQIAQRIKESKNIRQSLAELEVQETSRPIKEILDYDIPTIIQALEYYSYLPSILPSGSLMPDVHSNHNFSYTKREPIGITIGIGAWNYPLVNAIMKSIPALTFGNSMIYKPSEYTPSTTLLLAQLYEESGVPPGAFQVILGNGETGKELIEQYSNSLQSSYNTIGKITFTGSVETGRHIAVASSQNTKTHFHKLNLELGGKSPIIIFDDCNLNEAITHTMNANWYSNGQVCSNGTRVYVHTSIYDTFIRKLVEQTSKLNIGHPMNEKTDIGPMISKEQMEKVLEYVDIGINVDGANLIYGGERVTFDNNNNQNGNIHDDGHDDDMDLSNGYFLSPAIFTDCDDNMRIVKEEVFGMLMSVMTFDDEDEVLRRANDTDYGLGAGIFTNDIKRAHRVAANLKAGTVWINNYNLSQVQMPWSGIKQSGIGSENGIDAQNSWTTQKLIYVDTQ